jgi:predicted small secreted protein
VGTGQITNCICRSSTINISHDKLLTVATKISAANGAIKGTIIEKNRENPKKATATHPLKDIS